MCVHASLAREIDWRNVSTTLQEDFQSVIDNMMKQLLSKDIMYLPMKQICEKVCALRVLDNCTSWP